MRTESLGAAFSLSLSLSELGRAGAAHRLGTASRGWCTAGPLLFRLYSSLYWESSGWHRVFERLLQDLIHTENSYFIHTEFIHSILSC